MDADQRPNTPAASITGQLGRTGWLARAILSLVVLSVTYSTAVVQGQETDEDSEEPVLPPVIVEAVVDEPEPAPIVSAPSGPANRADSLLEISPSASQGVIGRQDLATRPLLDATQILNAIPDITTTQEAGGGDAPVYYVRGVNVEHGTDFALFVDDMPVNFPTHAHAQGLASLNFLIPEVVEVIDYRKGSYYADLGDFSTVGAANIRLARTLPESIDRLGAGQYGWVRGLAAGSGKGWGGDVLYAADLSYFDNGFDVAETNKRFKGLIKYTTGDDCEGQSTSLMAFHGDWFTTEAQRLTDLIANGLYSNFDPTTGGRESRFSWNTQYWREECSGRWQANAFAIYDRFDIFTNPEQELDEQVHQPDGRLVTGVNVARSLDLCLGERPSTWTFGLQLRDYFINRLRRERTQARNVLDVEKSHRVNIFSVSPYVENETRWTDSLRTTAGVRSDIFQFNATDLLDRTIAYDRSSGLVSPKLSIAFGPWADTEYYLNLGTGFHSNDARGPIDPMDPSPALLARTQSGEVGLRSEAFCWWQTTAAVWYQKFSSEQVFNAEEGETENLGPSRRYGVEWNNTFPVNCWLTGYVDWAWAHVRFVDGTRIPRSLSSLLSAGVTANSDNGLYGSLYFRHLSPRPLDEDGSVFSGSVEVANLEVGWRNCEWQFAVDVFNVFGSRDFQEMILEESLLARPLDPTQVRFTITRYY